MKNGFIKVAAGTPKIRVADCEYNADSIIEMIKQSADLGAKLIVLPELVITGYTCGDLFFQRTLTDGAEKALERIIDETSALDIIAVVGIPVLYGSKLYNCAAVIYKGQLLGLVPKSHLPNYNEFMETRYFTPADGICAEIRYAARKSLICAKQLFCCKEMPEFVLGVEVCEDLWTVSPPSAGLVCAGATVVANVSASDETIGKDAYRRELVKGQSARLLCGYVYADAGEGESSTDMVFAGHNLICENGAVLIENCKFEYGIIASEVDVAKLSGERKRITTFPKTDDTGYLKTFFSMPPVETRLSRSISTTPFIPKQKDIRDACCEDILTMQQFGLKKRLEHTNAKTAVVGVSGGLDSALALLVTVRAMDLLKRPRTDVVAVTMPCFGTTARTKGNAEMLCECLGVTFKSVNIKASVEQHFSDIGQDADNHDVTYENSQARERTQVLMDIANMTGGMVIGTGDLSELALGWATYNGDHMSMYGVNASVPKTLVRHLVNHEACKTEDKMLSRVLLDILDTPVSPELLPAKDGNIAQKTEDIVGPYELHDFFLYYLVRWGFDPLKIFRLAKYAFAGEYDDAVILKWEKIFFRRFFAQQFKRSCLPDGTKVGSVTLSPRGDWRMPSDASARLWLEQLEKIEN